MIKTDCHRDGALCTFVAVRKLVSIFMERIRPAIDERLLAKAVDLFLHFSLKLGREPHYVHSVSVASDDNRFGLLRNAMIGRHRRLGWNPLERAVRKRENVIKQRGVVKKEAARRKK